MLLSRRIQNYAIPKETWNSVIPQQKHRSVQGLECNHLSKSKNSSSVNQGMPAYTESHSFPDILRVHIPIQTQMCIYTCRVIVLGWTSRIACIFSDAPNNLNCVLLYTDLVDKTSFFLKGYNFYVLIEFPDLPKECLGTA